MMSNEQRMAEALAVHWSRVYHDDPMTFHPCVDGAWGVRQSWPDTSMPDVFWTVAFDSAGEAFASHATRMIRLSHISLED